MKHALAALACLAFAAPAAAAADGAIHEHYAGYSHGFNVLDLDTTLALRPGDYRLAIDYRTSGVLGALIGADGSSVVDGRFAGERVEPRELFSHGHLRGAARVTQLNWTNGSPTITQMVPAVEEERDPVPAELQAHTVDTLSAMASLLHQVTETGRCEGALRMFDGRRLSDVSARTVGPETLEETSRSSFQGPALRCDFDGRQIAGFKRSEEQAVLRKPTRGSAWFARLDPDKPLIPVRIFFSTARFGDITLYIRQS